MSSIYHNVILNRIEIYILLKLQKKMCFILNTGCRILIPMLFHVFYRSGRRGNQTATYVNVITKPGLKSANQNQYLPPRSVVLASLSPRTAAITRHVVIYHRIICKTKIFNMKAATKRSTSQGRFILLRFCIHLLISVNVSMLESSEFMRVQSYPVSGTADGKHQGTPIYREWLL